MESATNTQKKKANKKVILLLLDSLMHKPLQKAINNGDANTFQFFLEHGQYYPDMISPFPTMSVNVDSTLLTGVYADKHQVPGLVWFQKDEQRLINYGSHIRELLKLGLNKAMTDILFHLNNKHLNRDVRTIHEELAAHGKNSCSINTLIYRGDTNQSLRIPALVSLFTGVEREIKTKAPAIFSYGAMAKINPSNRTHFFWRRYGFHNTFAINELSYLIKEKKLPDLTIVYFPYGDKSVHKNGPMDMKGIKKVNNQLAKMLNNCFHSWEDALQEYTWIMIGDNGQSWVGPNRQEALIDLRKLLKSYEIVKLKDGVTTHDEIVLGVNERMAFIYSLDVGHVPLEQIAEKLQQDNRIDLISWKEGAKIHVISGEKEGKLSFQPEGEYFDQYKQTWTLDGTTDILDLEIKNKKIIYGDYPDGLARLYSSFFSHEGEYVVISAKPGYEIIGEGSPTHVGGASHGALHKDDSFVPMIVTGTESTPKSKRFLDLKDWLMSLIL